MVIFFRKIRYGKKYTRKAPNTRIGNKALLLYPIIFPIPVPTLTHPLSICYCHNFAMYQMRVSAGAEPLAQTTAKKLCSAIYGQFKPE